MNILYDYSHILSAVLAVVKDGLQKSSPAQKVMDDNSNDNQRFVLKNMNKTSSVRLHLDTAML